MANGLTFLTKEDGAIQKRRVERAEKFSVKARQVCGWSIGRGYESDYLEGILVSDAMRYRQWLAYFVPQQPK